MMYKFMTLDDGTEVVHSDPFDQELRYILPRS